MTIRVLIVDDEKLAREGIRIRLNEASGLEIIGEAADGPAAVRTILRRKPDLVFLDVELPGFNGFEVLKRVSPEHLPLVVFATAYDRYAVKAFEKNAVDYLLKPIRAERFEQALKRAQTRLADEVMLSRAHRGLIDAVYESDQIADVHCEDLQREATRRPIQRLAVKHGDRFLVLKTEEIEWVDTAANYLELHVRGKTFLLRMTMNELEERLDPHMFVRVHRTTIVNLDCVLEVTPSGSGDFTVQLHGGQRLPLSRSYRDRFFSHLIPDRPDASGNIEESTSPK